MAWDIFISIFVKYGEKLEHALGINQVFIYFEYRFMNIEFKCKVLASSLIICQSLYAIEFLEKKTTCDIVK